MIRIAQFPGACNKCGAKCKYYIRAGSISMRLCTTCLNDLALEARTLVVKEGDAKKEENNG